MPLDFRVVISAVDKLSGPVQNISKTLDQASSAAQRARTSLEGLSTVANSLSRVGNYITAAGGAIIGSFSLMSLKTAAAAEELKKAIAITGMGAEQFSRLAYVAQQNEVEVSGLITALRFLLRNVGEVAAGTAGKEVVELFQELGIAVTDASGRLRDGFDILLDVADALKNAESAEERMRIAMTLLGRGAAQVLPLLTQGAATLTEQMQEAAKEGIGWTQKQVEAADAWGDALDALRTQGAELLRDFALPFMQTTRGLIEVLRKIVQWLLALPSPIKSLLAAIGGAGGLTAIIAGLVIKLGALVIQTYAAITASRVYAATLRAEAVAAGEAATASAALQNARIGATVAVGGKALGWLGSTATRIGQFAGPAGIGIGAFVVAMTMIWNRMIAPEVRKIGKSLEGLDELATEARKRGLEPGTTPSTPTGWEIFKQSFAEVWGRFLGIKPRKSAIEKWAESPVTRTKTREQQENMLQKLKQQLEVWQTFRENVTEGSREYEQATQRIIELQKQLIAQLQTVAEASQGPTNERQRLEFMTEYWRVRKALAEEEAILEKRKSQEFEKQSELLEKQKGLMHEQIQAGEAYLGMLEAYAEALEASGRGYAAFDVRRQIQRQRTALGQQQISVGRRLMQMGETVGGLGTITAGWKTLAESFRQRYDINIQFSGNPDIVNYVLRDPAGRKAFYDAVGQAINQKRYEPAR